MAWSSVLDFRGPGRVKTSVFRKWRARLSWRTWCSRRERRGTPKPATQFVIASWKARNRLRSPPTLEQSALLLNRTARVAYEQSVSAGLIDGCLSVFRPNVSVVRDCKRGARGNDRTQILCNMCNAFEIGVANATKATNYWLERLSNHRTSGRLKRGFCETWGPGE